MAIGQFTGPIGAAPGLSSHIVQLLQQAADLINRAETGEALGIIAQAKKCMELAAPALTLGHVDVGPAAEPVATTNLTPHSPLAKAIGAQQMHAEAVMTNKTVRLEQAANLLRIIEAIGAADDDLGEDGEQIIGAIGLARKLIVEVVDQLKAERGQGGAS